MPKKSNLHLNTSGFTIIEMVVVIGMIAIIAGISIINFRQGQKQRAVALAFDSITNAIRTAQNLTQSGKIIPADAVLIAGPGGCADPAALDYYISFTLTSSFTIYAEDKCVPKSVYQIQQFTLPVNTAVSTLSLNVNDGNQTALDIKFTPPFAILTASGSGGGFASFTGLTITVSLTGGGPAKVITVDGISGRIGE